jgi:hypothetical protein
MDEPNNRKVIAVLKVSGTPISDDRFIVAILRLNEQGDPDDSFEWLTPENTFFSLDRARDIARTEAQIRGLPLEDGW